MIEQTRGRGQRVARNNDLLRKIMFRSKHGRKEGMCRIHKVNTLLHERTKLEVMYWLMKHGYTVHSEVEFLDMSGRADIVAIQNGQGFIVEILASESEEKYFNKTVKYPKEFTMVKVYAKDFKYNEFAL